jgi:hypothetical protein
MGAHEDTRRCGWPTPSSAPALSLLLSSCGRTSTDDDELACLALPDEVSWFHSPVSDDWNDVLVDAKQHSWLAGVADGTLGASAVEPSGNSRAGVHEYGTAADEVARRVAVDACGHAVAVASVTTNGQRAGLLWHWRP